VLTGEFRNGTLSVTDPIARESRAANPISAAPPKAACQQNGATPKSVEPQASVFLGQLESQYRTTFAGGWLDPDGVLVARFTDAPAPYSSLAETYGSQLCIERAPSALASLQPIMTAIQDDQELAAFHVQLVSVRVDQVNDRLEVRLDVAVPEAVAFLRSKYGDGVDVKGVAEIL
jgi:hypothetical protein